MVFFFFKYRNLHVDIDRGKYTWKWNDYITALSLQAKTRRGAATYKRNIHFSRDLIFYWNGSMFITRLA